MATSVRRQSLQWSKNSHSSNENRIHGAKTLLGAYDGSIRIIFYEGDEFYEWNGNAFIGGLKSKALVRIGFVDGEPFEAERFSWAKRVRDVEMDHDGAIWVIEDGPNGRLIKFTKPTE
jgi:glucose/arabinose dehydrogenase